MQFWLILALAATAFAGERRILFEQSAFEPSPAGGPAGWGTWSARPEIAPRFDVAGNPSRGGGGSLLISGAQNPAAHGGWERSVESVQAGRWYRLTAYYRVENAVYEPLNVITRLEWMNAAGKRAGQPGFAYQISNDGPWRRAILEVPAPSGAAAARIQLQLANAPDAKVWFDDIRLEEISAPPPRPVKVAAVRFRPSGRATREENVAKFVAAVEKTVTEKVDVILLSEGITVVGTGKKYADVAEPIPGPTTEALGALARRKNAYIVAGVYERAGPGIYNVSVLLDRQGKLAGKYRKVYIPREEIEGGITPGDSYPVFRTDFGRVGMMICYDVFYADPARALALNGAELILMPIWGGKEALGRARAIENRVFIAASGYDYPTYVQDPDGETLALAPANGSAAIATIDLNRRYDDPHLGSMRERLMRELRLDLPAGRPEFARQ
ncbi:MAG: carbon-nitrogen hydrolase family protein [Acidobacteria bacterium]|nr:carbon-nitrogen hydrolase family protein [Acidobacteriota bacterium]